MRVATLSLLVALFGLASHSCAAQSTSASQSSTSASATSTSTSATATSSLIPTDISASCSSFLTKLNTDPTIQACTRPLLTATQYYQTQTEAAKSKSSKKNETDSSANALENSLGQLCATDTGCEPGVIRQQLSKFWSACSDEMKQKKDEVIKVYDVLYLINPFHEAVCTKDDSNNYCVMSIANDTATQQASNSTTSRRSLLHSDFTSGHHHRHHRRQDATQSTDSGDDASESAQELDQSGADSNNIAFLFLQPNSPKDVLCSSCSKNIMAAYISFETSIPYAIGLANSETLTGQSALYKAMVDTCGKDYTTSVNEKAGTTAFAEVGGAIGSAHVRIGATLAVAAVLAGVLLA